MVELGVVQPVQQVNGPGAGGREAYDHLAGELGVGAGAEGGDLLVAGLNELDLVAVLVKAAQDAVDAVAGVAVYAVDAVLVKALEDIGSDGFGDERGSLLLVTYRRVTIRAPR